MTPGHAAELVNRWVRWYTRRLPGPVAGRRIEEIRADLYDHIAHERASGTSERLIAVRLLSRMIRGSAADVRWRAGNRSRRTTSMKSLTAALAMAAVGAAAMVYGENDDAPGLVLIGLLLILAAITLWLRAAYRRRGRAGAK